MKRDKLDKLQDRQPRQKPDCWCVSTSEHSSRCRCRQAQHLDRHVVGIFIPDIWHLEQAGNEQEVDR